MRIVLLSGDLMVLSRVESAARQLGAEFKSASDVASAIDACQTSHAEVLVVDLASASLDIAALLGGMNFLDGARPRTIAFGPHVHEERLQAARQAGCDEVVSRGQFFGQLDTILARCVGE